MAHKATPAYGPTMTESGLVSFAASDLALQRLDLAERFLTQARQVPSAGQQFVAAQLAATRAGSAVLAITGKPQRGEASRNMWLALIKKAPQFTAAAQRFAAAAQLRRDITNGMLPHLGIDDAAAFLESAAAFVADVEHFVCSA